MKYRHWKIDFLMDKLESVFFELRLDFLRILVMKKVLKFIWIPDYK